MDQIPLRAYLTARARLDVSSIGATSALELLTSGHDILTYDGNGVAHVDVEGILTPNGPDLIDMLMGQGGTGYRNIMSSLEQAHEEYLASGDRDTPIVMHVNSPGGMLNGAEATAAMVSHIASQRPVIAINEGVMASAAYWIASGATDIAARGMSPLTGSIGAIQTVVEANSDDITIHTFVNPESPDKAPNPSTDEGAKVYQDRLSDVYSVFKSDILAGRGSATTEEKIAGLKGAVVTSEKALEAGLIDRVFTISDSVFTPAVAGEDREENMNLSELLQEHTGAKAELDALISQARSEGEQAATDRHTAIVAKLKPIMDGGYPERVKTACADAIAGTRSVDSVLDLVAIFDEIKASKESVDSNEEQEDMPDTPSTGPEIKTIADEATKRDAEWNTAIKAMLG